MIQKKSFSFLFFLLCSAYYPTTAQQSNSTLNSDDIAITIDSIASKLNTLYVYPEVAKKMSENLQEKFLSGAYNTISDPIVFANQLTNDLQAISKDKHLRAYFDPEEIAEEQNAISQSERAIRQKVRIENMQKQKFGFEVVKILDGRIGYLDLRSFMDTQFAAQAAHKAINRIINSDAIIIDLRKNIGGSPSMIQLLSSYFFSDDSVHLNTFYFRPTNEYTETWTLPTLPNKRRPDVDLYILTSNRTFSAAEEFAYNFKNLNRATIIGETTAGGAHPGGPISATDKFRVWMPQGRAINPITNSNWEGIGVKPDIEVPANEALTISHINALENQKASAISSALIHSYNESINELKRTLESEQAKYADILVDAHFEKWNNKYSKFYGGNRLLIWDTLNYEMQYIDPKAVLGNNYNFVSLPAGSYVIVQFTDNLVFDHPGSDDLFIEEYMESEHADIYVSSDGTNFEFLGTSTGGYSSFDLSAIKFEGIVKYVKVVGLDLGGWHPGFDLVSIYGLPGFNKYIPEVEIEKYLKEPNEYQQSILLKTVEFEFESYNLLPQGTAYLDKLVEMISKNPDLKLKIIGHTDNVGSEEFNDQLSIRRAKSVYDYFTKRGIKHTNLEYEGRGKREPLTQNENEEGRKKNRRVELIKIKD